MYELYFSIKMNENKCENEIDLIIINNNNNNDNVGRHNRASNSIFNVPPLIHGAYYIFCIMCSIIYCLIYGEQLMFCLNIVGCCWIWINLFITRIAACIYSMSFDNVEILVVYLIMFEMIGLIITFIDNNNNNNDDNGIENNMYDLYCLQRWYVSDVLLVYLLDCL